MKIAAAVSGDRLSTSGNIDVCGRSAIAIFRSATRMPSWSSARNVVDGTLAIGGARGGFAPADRSALAGSETATNARAFALRSARDDQRSRSLALGGGARISEACRLPERPRGAQRFAGAIRNSRCAATRSIENGTLGPLTLETATARRAFDGARVVVDRAELVTPGLSATASGRSDCARSIRSICRCTRRQTICRGSSIRSRA